MKVIHTHIAFKKAVLVLQYYMYGAGACMTKNNNNKNSFIDDC